MLASLKRVFSVIATNADSLSDLRAYWHGGMIDIEGWVHPELLPALEVLQQTQQDRAIKGGALEIGLHHAKFFVALLLMLNNGEKGVGIDVFEDQYKNVDGSGKGNLEIVEQNIKRYAHSDGDVRLMKRDTLSLNAKDRVDLLSQCGPFRLISIDGGHTSVHAINDLLFAQDILQNGGVVILDDWVNSHWPGVMEGVAHLFTRHIPRVAPFAWGLNKLLLTDITHHQSYFEAFGKRYAGTKGFKLVELFHYATVAF